MVKQNVVKVKAKKNSIFPLVNDKKKCLEFGLSGFNLVQNECNTKSMVEKITKCYTKIVNR